MIPIFQTFNRSQSIFRLLLIFIELQALSNLAPALVFDEVVELRFIFEGRSDDAASIMILNVRFIYNRWIFLLDETAHPHRCRHRMLIIQIKGWDTLSPPLMDRRLKPSRCHVSLGYTQVHQRDYLNTTLVFLWFRLFSLNLWFVEVFLLLINLLYEICQIVVVTGVEWKLLKTDVLANIWIKMLIAYDLFSLMLVRILLFIKCTIIKISVEGLHLIPS